MRKVKQIIAISLSLFMLIPTVKVEAASENEQSDDTSSAYIEELSEGLNSDFVESYGYDSIVEEAEAEQEYRDSVDCVDNTIVFSVLDYRKKGEKTIYLKDSDAICKNNNLKNVSFILDTKKEDVEQKDRYTAYQVFYEATVKTNDIWQVVDTLSTDENILTAEPDFIWKKSAEDYMTEVSGEALSAEIECAGWSYRDLDCTGIWGDLKQKTAPGEGVVVAVIDTGVDYNHIDLKKNMWVNSGEIAGNGIDDDGNGYIDDVHGINLIDPAKQGDPMDDHGHGTHVAGIIGMTAGNGGGVGIAYGSKIMAIKAGQASGVFASTDIAKAVKYAAANGADVINMSFGGTGRSNLVEAALADAFGSCVLVAAAGNDGLPTTDAPPSFSLTEDMYPAGYSYVLGVMACDSNGNKADFSNWDYKSYANCEYEMIAPGVQIYSTIPGNRYARWSGTSMASPMVAAAAAIIRREYPDTSKYSSRYIMGQLSSATRDSVTYIDKEFAVHEYKKLNISDSLNLTPKPAIAVSDISFFDGKDISDVNNKDGVVQAGETIDLGFLISNHWGIAKDVQISVDAKSVADIDNPYVEFITDSIDLEDEIGTFGTINNGYKYVNDELIGVDNPIRLKISDEAPNDLIVTINYEVTAKNGMNNKDQSIYVATGKYTFVVQRGTYLRGIINEDMTLTSDKLWIVDRALTISEDVTVNVDPGTQIQFYSIEEGPYAENHMANILVKGKMIFNGTKAKPIEIYPCKGRESFVVDIKRDTADYDSSSIINMSYVKIRNPEIRISTGDHLNLSQDELWVRKFINNGHIVINDTDGLHVCAESINNSKVSNFNHYMGETKDINNGRIQANLDTVLFNNDFVGYDSICNFNSCVFLKNHKITRDNGDVGSILYLSDSQEYKNNAILNDLFFNTWFNIQVYRDANLKQNYWGVSNENLINKMIIDSEDDSSLGKADYSNYLTIEDDLSTIYPFVTEAYITDSTGEHRLSQVVNSQTVQVHVKFNRDMSQDVAYEPMVSFGSAEPYTDFVVDGDWASDREWVGTIKIDPFINQGTEYLRIKDAAAADDLWLTTGNDSARFSFDITKSSAEALTLQGSGGSNENNLNWVQDDYDTLAGYNLYRATTYDSSKDIEEQSFEKINTSIIANETKEYTDTDVEQGQDYYYYFTVVDTQFAESPASNIVKCTPFDEEKPMISTKAIETKTVGTAVNISADITDNVEVKGATLYYKSSGDELWKNIKMRNTSGDTYQAVIPAYDVKEGTMQYYISATDGTNTTTAGSEEVPNVFSVIGIIDVESITLNDTVKDITIGDSYQLEATILPENATDKSVIWSSTDENIATVDDEGNISSIAAGEVTITATSKDGKKSASCNITVKPILVTDLTIEPEENTILIGDTFTIKPEVLPENATNKSVSFESENTKVATVDTDGKVTAVGVGETNIIVSTDDDSELSKTCKVTVNPIKVKSVSLDESSKILDIGDEFTLTANIYPENATNKDVIWTSSNDKVATVVDGKVTALKGGKTTITVETEDGSFKAICNVVVNSILTTDIILSKDELTLDVGESETLTVEVEPVNATSNTFIWKSDDKDIATVSDGKIVAVGAGKTFIKCTTTDGTDITKMCSVEVYDTFAKPDKPVVQSKSLTSVTLKPIAGALYSKDGTNWVESNEFSGLTENTEYSFFIKLKADGYYHESDASEATVVKTDESTISISGIELDKSSLNLMVGETDKLTASIVPEDSSVTDLNWNSTNTSVATVDAEGNISAKAIGLTYIMCKTTDGSDKTAICTVKVYDQYEAPQSIEVDTITEDSITIIAIEGCEYKIGTGNWSDSVEFTGLEANTEYEISVRKAASGYHKASEIITAKFKTLDHIFDQEKVEDKYLKSAANCTNPAVYYKSCKCGEKGTETFEYGEVGGHVEVVDEKVEATCSKTGLTEGKHCSVCGEVIVEQEIIQKSDHTWNEGTIIKNPTCIQKGIKKYTCTVCGATKAENVEAKGHTEVTDEAVEATCSKEGLTVGSHCSECGETIVEQEIIPKLDHTWNEGETVKDATCTENGYMKYTCTVCNRKKTVQIKATDHVEETVAAVEATCTKSGKSEYKRCSVCGETLEEPDIIPALGHDWDDGEVSTPATGTQDGTKTFHCKRKSCSSAKTETIPATGHEYGSLIVEVPATCTKDGVKAHYKCLDCNKLYIKENGTYYETTQNNLIIKATGHTEEVIPEVVATCTKAGNTAGKKCSVCGDIIDAPKEIPATGHRWDEGKVTKEPTETEKGIKTFTCTECKETRTEEIPAKGKKDNPDEKSSEQTVPAQKPIQEDGVGTISADGKTLTDIDGVKFIVAEKMTADQLTKNAMIADKASAGKYKITAVTMKNGKITGGTVTYMKPYNKNCKTANIKKTIKIAGATFKITALNKNAFKNCKKLTKVNIGANITKIGANAFNGCKKLKTITINTTKLKNIGSKAFKGINSKAKFKLPKKLKKKQLTKYKKMIKKAKAPAKAKYTK